MRHRYDSQWHSRLKVMWIHAIASGHRALGTLEGQDLAVPGGPCVQIVLVGWSFSTLAAKHSRTAEVALLSGCRALLLDSIACFQGT
jgi:hypothetical protein